MAGINRVVIPRVLRIPFLLCLLISSSVTLLVLVAYFTAQPVIPMFYSLAQPKQQLAAKEWLFLFPFLSFVITGLHIAIARWLYPQTRVIVQLFSWTTLAIQIMLALSLVRILVIVM